MKAIKTILLILIAISIVLCSQISALAEESTYTMEVELSLSSSGVVYPNSPSSSMLTDDDDYAWLITKRLGSASIFQYDLSSIPSSVNVTKAEWKILVGEPISWSATFTSFKCEQEFMQSINYTEATNLGYDHPKFLQSNCFLTRSISESDYVSVPTSEYKGETLGTIYSTGNQLTFDLTSEVNKFRDAGKTKFNFGVANGSITSSRLRIPTALSPLPMLVITFTLDDSVNVDNMTTTRYNDWITNLHPTSPIQIALGINGGEAGQAGQALAISPSNPEIMACGNDQAGVYTSEDGGVTWKNTSDGFMSIGVSDLMFYPEDSNILIAMGTNNSPRTGKNTGIYRSEDGGNNWNLVKQLPVAQRAGRYLQYGDKIDGIYPLYAATNSSGILSGIYVSYDMGLTWKPTGLDTQVIWDLYTDGDFIAASTAKNGLFISTDGGKHWKRTSLTSGLPREGVRSFIKDPLDDMHMFVTDAERLFETTDGGENWSVINTANEIGVESLKTLDIIEDPEQDGRYIICMGTSIPGPSVRYSLDNGRSFTKALVYSEMAFMTDVKGYIAEPIEIDYNTKTIFAFFDGDLHKSTDGGRSFYPSMSGYSGMRSRDYVFDANDPYYLGIAQTDRGFMQTVDGYETSEYRPFDYNIVLAAGRFNGARTVWTAEKDPDDFNHIIICMGGINGESTDALKRSTDNGKTWSVIEESTAYQKWSGINRIYFHPQNSDIIYAGYLKSVDGGETWTDLGRMVSAVSPQNGDIVYSISSGGNSVVSLSEDGGATWTEIASGFTSSLRAIVDTTNPYILYTGTFMDGIIKIDAEKKNKSFINNGMVRSEGVLNIKDISQDPSNPLHLVAGGANNYTYAKSGGLFESFDGGENWKVVEGLPGSRDIWTVEFHPTLPKVYIGTSAGTFVYEWKNNPENLNYIN